MKKIAAIIEARMTSSRLPGKVLLESGINKPLLLCLIERIRKVKNIDQIIIATTTNSQDNKIVEFCKENKINFFRGSENDVMARVLNASLKFEVDIIIEITGDCPIIDPEIISLVLNTHLENQYDYTSNCNFRSFPDGMDVQVFSTKILSNSYKLVKTKLEKEHVTLEIRKSSKYSKINLVAPQNYFLPDLGLTLDEEGDYLLISSLFKHFKNNDFGLKQILDFLKEKNQLIELNKNVVRKGDT
tara:strand:+ start:9382 stop:10113 length:732 start_codon:yes stop_codon:yes gene_type:complete